MSDETPARQDRQVRIQTPDGALEGFLCIAPRVRTLDDLNLVAKCFLTLHSPRSLTRGWEPSAGPLAINKASILFLRELSAPPPQSGGRFGSFTRQPIRLRIHEFEIEGFVHVPPGGSSMKRLDQNTHPFLPLTSVCVSGPGEQWTATFLIVNRSHITAAQVMELGAEQSVDLCAGAECQP